MEFAIQSLLEMIQTLTRFTPLKRKSNPSSQYNSNISIENKLDFSFNDACLNLLAQAFLLAPSLSQKAKQDLMQDFANLIIRKLKVLSRDSKLTLSTSQSRQTFSNPRWNMQSL